MINLFSLQAQQSHLLFTQQVLDSEQLKHRCQPGNNIINLEREFFLHEKASAQETQEASKKSYGHDDWIRKSKKASRKNAKRHNG